jgi:hypothetical protein
MDNRKTDLKKLLQTSVPEKPSSDFTPIVMNEVSDVHHELTRTSVLKRLLMETSHEKIPADFTINVIAKLDTPLFHKAHPPVISQRIWWTCLSAVILFLSWILLTGQNYQSPKGVTHYLLSVGNKIATTLSNEVSSTYVTTLIAVSGLMIIDYVLKNKIRLRARG